MSSVFGQESLSSLQVDSGVLSLNYFPVLSAACFMYQWARVIVRSSWRMSSRGRFRSGVLLKGTLTLVTSPPLLISEPSEKLSD